MSRMCNIDDREDIALYRNILHNDEWQKISCTLIKDQCKNPKMILICESAKQNGY